MRKNIIKIGAFLAILMGILVAAGWVFTPKDNTENAGMQEISASGILGEAENSLDVIFLGDSEAYCAFMPLRVWDNVGITSYVSSTVDQKLYETVGLLKTVLQRQTPRYVFLETNVLYRRSSRMDEVIFKFNELMPVFRYHDHWKKLQWRDFFAEPEYTFVHPEKGFYNSLKARKARRIGKYMQPTDEIDDIPAGNAEKLEYMRDYCAERGTELILVSSPSTMNWDYARHNAVANEAERLGLTYVDLNTCADEVDIDWKKDTRDRGDHMNYFGAEKVTDYMTDYLIKTGLFTDKRKHPDYQNWNEAASVFYEDLKNKGVEIRQYIAK